MGAVFRETKTEMGIKYEDIRDAKTKRFLPGHGVHKLRGRHQAKQRQILEDIQTLTPGCPRAASEPSAAPSAPGAAGTDD